MLSLPRRCVGALLPVAVTGLVAAAAACADGGAVPAGRPLGAFNFTFEQRPPAEQVLLLDTLGYDGIAMYWPGAEAFAAFAATPAVREGRVHLRAVLVDFGFEPDWSREEMAALLSALAPQGTDLWLILGDPRTGPEARITALRELTLLATSRGVRVVLYPHEDTAMPSVEDTLALIEAVGLPELRTSLHLCHELKAGNRARLADIITRAAPRLALASIHGSSQDTSLPGWSTTILPLDRGDLDVQGEYLLPLMRAGYEGPILLHTFGLQEPPEQHLRRSHAAWEEMQRAVARALARP